MNFNWKIFLPSFDLSPSAVDSRLRARVSIAEAAGLLIALMCLGAYLWVIANRYGEPIDYLVYSRAVSGDTAGYFYAYWLLPLFSLFNALPLLWGYLLWSLLGIGSVFFAARVFGGNRLLVLASYQFLALLNFGQVTGLLLGGMALFYWGICHRRPWLAGLGLLVACTKFQLGIPVCAALLCFSPQPLREKLKILILPIMVAIGSLFLYPNWPFQLLSDIQQTPPDSRASVSLWQLVGPFALFAWIPPLLLPMRFEERINAIGAATVIGLPYFQVSDLVLLFIFPCGYLPLLGLAGFLTRFIKWPDFQFFIFLPIVFYLFAFFPKKPKKQAEPAQ